MKTDRSRCMHELLKLPNVGPATAGDLLRLGICRPSDLVGQDPDDLYRRLCALDGALHDPCVRDVFAAVVDHAGGGAARPWWTFTAARKARDAAAAIRGRKRARRA
jgi:hypothetical protein